MTRIAAVAAATLAVSGALLGSTAGAEQASLSNGDTAPPVEVMLTKKKCSESGRITAAKVWDKKHFEGTPANICILEPCTTTYDDSDALYPYLSPFGWNNRISSVKTYHRCDVKFWDGEHYTNGHSTWIDQKGDLSLVGGGWNNRASSLRVS